MDKFIDKLFLLVLNSIIIIIFIIMCIVYLSFFVFSNYASQYSITSEKLEAESNSFKFSREKNRKGIDIVEYISIKLLSVHILYFSFR